MMRRVLVVIGLLLAVPAARFVALKAAARRVDRGSADAWRVRNDALARAQVFLSAPTDIASLDLTKTPRDPRPFETDELVTCQYVPKPTSGTTPKFDCRLPDGSLIKVKYGDNPEVPAELAATRLLAALGFGADYMSLVRRLRCNGCSWSPFRLRKAAEWYFIPSLHDRLLDSARPRDFEWVAVERKIEGRAIEVGGAEGWGFYDLNHVHEARGGAMRSHLDALRLMAMLLVHWDNKSSNQRLLCRDSSIQELAGRVNREDAGTPCARPVVMLQDLGSSFGPRKMNYPKWAATPIWTDPAACVISMDALPYHGATFASATISEGGRALVASRLRQLSERQIVDLFTGARFPDPITHETPARDVMPWVRAFLDKVMQIADRPSCPSFP